MGLLCLTYMQCMLRSGVWGRKWNSRFSRYTWHECKSSGIPFQEMGHEATRQIDHGKDVQVEHIQIDSNVNVFPTSSLRFTGVVKHDVDLELILKRKRKSNLWMVFGHFIHSHKSKRADQLQSPFFFCRKWGVLAQIFPPLVQRFTARWSWLRQTQASWTLYLCHLAAILDEFG